MPSFREIRGVWQTWRRILGFFVGAEMLALSHAVWPGRGVGVVFRPSKATATVKAILQGTVPSIHGLGPDPQGPNR